MKQLELARFYRTKSYNYVFLLFMYFWSFFFDWKGKQINKKKSEQFRKKREKFLTSGAFLSGPSYRARVI